MKDYLQNLQKEFPQIKTESTPLESTTKHHNKLVSASLQAFLKVSKLAGENPKLNRNIEETIDRFWKRFRQKNQTLFINEQVASRLVCFFYKCQQEDEVGRITANKLFSTKSFDIWNSRGVQFFEKSKFYYDQIKNKEIKSVNNLFEIDEKYRAKYFNEDKGFVFCIEFTTMWDPKSEYCSNCKFSSECQLMLKNNYPKIYKNRK